MSFFVEDSKRQLQAQPSHPVRLPTELPILQNASVKWIQEAYHYLKANPDIIKHVGPHINEFAHWLKMNSLGMGSLHCPPMECVIWEHQWRSGKVQPERTSWRRLSFCPLTKPGYATTQTHTWSPHRRRKCWRGGLWWWPCPDHRMPRKHLAQ